jgi:CRISPR type I-E-associated protein CasB/Cse2
MVANEKQGVGGRPSREVSWLITKLYAQFQFKQRTGYNLAEQLRKSIPHKSYLRSQSRFDQLLLTSLDNLEFHLRWALQLIREKFSGHEKIYLDWVQLTNDLSRWDRKETKINWANKFLNASIHNNTGE